MADIYVGRGLSRKLATDVAAALMNHDALGAHMRDELGMSELTSARPVQAALSSASSFLSGGVLPLIAALLLQPSHRVAAVWIASFLVLVSFAVVTARVSGARQVRVAIRMTFWGILAMAATTLAGAVFGARG